MIASIVPLDAAGRNLAVFSPAALLKLHGKRVQAERPQQVSPHPGLNGVQGMQRVFDPGKRELTGETFQLPALVEVGHPARRAGLDQQNVFQQAGKRAQKGGQARLPLCPGAVSLGDPKQGSEVGFPLRGR